MYNLGELDEKCYYASDILNGPAINLLFCCHIISYWEKVNFYEKFSHSLTLETQTVWEILVFQCCWWKYQNAEIYLNFQKVQLKWKIWQDPNSELPSRSYQPTNRYKLLTETYRNIQAYPFAVFRECSSCGGHGEMVQHNFFLTPANQKHVAGKFVKWVGIWLYCGGILFTMLNESRFVK